MMQRFIPTLSVLAGLLLTGLASAASAQNTAFGFEFREVAKVVEAGDTLRSPWAGGLDSPQFSSIDLNADSQDDLFIFDRRTRRVLTYLNAPAPGGGRQWQYAPNYAVLFPADLQNWALLRDYDCDGRPDLFTTATNGSDIRVFRNVAGPGGQPQFQLITSQLRATLAGSPSININTGANLPSIKDIDGDGRLDIVVVDWDTNRIISQYQNIGTTGCGGLAFELINEVWGNIRSCLGTCGAYVFSATPVLCRPSQVQHTFGGNLTLLDLDGDGDQDALMGRDYCTELVSMINQGTVQQAAMTSANANFPTAASAIRIPYFPAAYHLDVNFDGRADLLVAPSVYDNLDSIEIRRTVRYLENTSTGTAPNFVLRQPDFLQKDMIETSTQAAPAFLDVDADGRKDLLVSGLRRDAPGGFLVATLAYYRNTGTATRPVYQLVTNDYLNLSQQKFGGLRPTVVDLNRDGALELVCIGYYAIGRRQFLGYFRNLAPATQAPNFDTSTMYYIENVPNGSDDTVTFFDIDNDGFVDMLYGTNSNRADLPGESLRYYRNTGTSPLEAAFVVQNRDFGQIRTATGTRPINLYPLVADFDGDTTPDLLTVDASGTVRMFPNLRAQSGIFTDQTSLFYNADLGRYDDAYLGTRESNHFALAASDVNGDGAPELFIGMEAGGVLAAATRNRVLSTRATAAQAVPLTLYPNPATATATATVEAARPVSLTLLDLTGRVIRSAEPARRHQIDLRGVAAGLYLVRCQTADGQTGIQRLVVK